MMDQPPRLLQGMVRRGVGHEEKAAARDLAVGGRRSRFPPTRAND
jgi:hypothetical protein